MLQTAHLLIYHGKQHNGQTAHGQGRQGQQGLVVDIGREAHAAPPDAEQEVDDVAHGKELQRAAGVERSVAGVAAQVEVGIAGIDVTNADECHHHLDNKDCGGKNGNAPIDTHRGLEPVEPGCYGFHNTRI